MLKLRRLGQTSHPLLSGKSALVCCPYPLLSLKNCKTKTCFCDFSCSSFLSSLVGVFLLPEGRSGKKEGHQDFSLDTCYQYCSRSLLCGRFLFTHRWAATTVLIKCVVRNISMLFFLLHLSSGRMTSRFISVQHFINTVVAAHSSVDAISLHTGDWVKGLSPGL